MTLEEQLKTLCKEWQRRLRLQDWYVDVSVKKDKDFREDCRGAYGYCKANAQAKQAEIVIRDPLFHDDDPFHFDAEQVLVHELLHCYFPGTSIQESEDKHDLYSLEFAIDALSWALVRGYR